jgi:hypothetical protein
MPVLFEAEGCESRLSSWMTEKAISPGTAQAAYSIHVDCTTNTERLYEANCVSHHLTEHPWNLRSGGSPLPPPRMSQDNSVLLQIPRSGVRRLLLLVCSVEVVRLRYAGTSGSRVTLCQPLNLV